MLKYEIIINPKWLRKLDNDIWNDELVPAVLRIGEDRISIKIAYRGNVIRDKKKKSYRIVFQKPYKVNGAHEIHLNAEFSDVSLSRNKLSLDFFDRIGVISPHSQHVLLYINGKNKGIYLEIESFDQFLLKKRKLPDGAIIYATNNRANFSLITKKKELKKRLDQGYTLKYGDQEDMVDLKRFIAMINALSNEDFAKEIPQVLDVEKYLKWVSSAVCVQNYDGFIHNYALYKNSKTGLYEITPWDYDGTWGRNLHGRKLDYDYVPLTGFNTLSARLFHFPHFRNLYNEILTSILENDFTLEVQKPIIDELFDSLKPHMSLDPYINSTAETLELEKKVYFNFIKKRNAFLKKELTSFIKVKSI
ncbi:CotH kinase family protein [Bacillus sp. sid0103]|uniref:CotH kinase family protein n=1 Tax=Bacillus sp. sid0103 TaxID=2856337 RepID=UPI001C4783E7|nr:CotH kinase family protein [Bacillus sp. sid0103]MBV7506577.1 CotH kinase family protein [Bacillus sp. sid0103]